MLKKILSTALLLTVLFAGVSNAQGPLSLNTTEFEKAIAKSDIQVLDVRTQEEYNNGHISKAFLADWNQKKSFEDRIQYLDKDKPVYTYCLSGGRSTEAANRLLQAGFKEVYNLTGGLNAWKSDNKPVLGSGKSKQLTMEDYLAYIPDNQTVLVDIGASYCPPCRKMKPILQELVNRNDLSFRVLQVDGGEQQQLAKELNAYGFPTFIIYKGGKEVWRKEGVVTKEELAEQLRS